MRGRRITVTRTILLACLLLACSPCALALNPDLDVSQYAHTSWKIRDGFTKGRITNIAQTRDGYLWLGTDLGLLRFDGVRNVPLEPPADQHLPSNTIAKLLAARDGTLWIGTDKGLASWNGSSLTQYPELAGQFVFALLQDRDGTVWVGTGSFSSNPIGKLCAINNGNIKCYGEDGAFGRGLLELFEDRSGSLWAKTEDRLWRWKPGPPQFFPLPDHSFGTRDIAEDFDGALLVATDVGIKRFVDGKTEAYVPPSSLGQFKAVTIFRDAGGGLWIGTLERGFMHIHQGRAELFSSHDGLSGDTVGTFFEDREGNIWVGTQGGLDRFREFAVPTFTLKEGLSGSFVDSVLGVSDGSVLVATNGGLTRWNNGQFGIFGKSNEQSQQGKSVPWSLFQDVHGRIWGVTNREFGYIENERFIAVNGIPGGVARSIAEDKHGDLWITNEHVGLFHLRGTQVVEQIPWSKLGDGGVATALAVDPSQGGLWVGFFTGGVAYFSEGQIRVRYGTTDGLGSGLVNDFQFDPDGTVWIATASGLSRLRNNHIATLTTRNGLACDSVQWLREDDDYFLWLYSACGLMRIARTELEAWSAAVDQNKDAKQTVQATVFDSSDGVATRAYPIGLSPQVARTADGKLWFPGSDGVSVVDPHHLAFNKLPPPIHIEQITADRKPYEVTAKDNGNLRLPALSRDLEIDYTALSLVAPEKIRFRYKLEGYDKDWQDAGNRRQAFYTNLPPRSYRFRVMACNNSGVWNEAGTYLDFAIAPAYYQTIWFRLLLLVAFVLILATLYRLRLRQVAATVRGRMEERLAERERIARDLHDTLLQSVQGLILKFDAATKKIRNDDAARSELEKTLDHADEVLAEGRDRLRNLRGSSIPTGGLPAAFERVAEETPQHGEMTFKTVVEGHVLELHPMVSEEAYSIGREAIVNALIHSQGHHVEVEITYDPRQFRLRVRDDGRGIDERVLADGSRADHFGLPGMRERAQRIGGQLQLWSRHETGTEVELSVPAATAYRSSVDGRTKSFWDRRVRRSKA